MHDATDRLAAFEESFAKGVKDGDRLLGWLRNAGLAPTRIERPKHAHAAWLLYLQPAPHLQQSFELAPELLALVISAPGAQARDIEQAERALAEELRLDHSLVLVFSRDPQAQRELDPAVSETGRTYMFFDIAEALATRQPEWLRESMLERFGSSDLFATGRPVFGWDFFGRKTELQLMRRHLDAGHPIGLYGLRKIGKTSMMLHELHRLTRDCRSAREAGNTAAGFVGLHVDLQALSIVDGNLAGFMRRIVRAAFEAMERSGVSPKEVGLDPNWGRTAALRGLRPQAAIQRGIETLELLIDWANASTGRRILIFIDEYERFFDPDVFAAKDGLAALDHMRGLVQTYPRIFNFVIAGLVRTDASRSSIRGRQNPLFKFVVDFPLAGIDRETQGEMLQRIGRRMGLDFDHRAKDLIWAQTGGHPALARDLGRVIDHRVPMSDRIAGKKVTHEVVKAALPDFMSEAAIVMQDIAQAITRLDSRIPFALSEFITTSSIAALAQFSKDSMVQLERLGIIVKGTSGMPVVGIGALATWLLDNYPHQKAAAGG